MPIEIIDLTDSSDGCPPSSPMSSSNTAMVLNFAAVPANPNHHHIHHHQTTLWPTPALAGHTYDYSQIAPNFQPNNYPGRVTTYLEPVPESNTFLFPNGARLREPWTQREHELFLIGLIKFGKGRWSKIQKHFLWNKTPHQVQSYANSFLRHLSATNVYGFRRRKPVTNYSIAAAANLMATNRNLMHYILMIANAAPSQETLALFPEKAPFSKVPPYGGEASGTTTMTYGFEMLTGGASNSITANEDVDLELRMG